MLFVACSDDTDSNSTPPESVDLHLFRGWTAEVPISSEVDSIAFENWGGAEWERIGTVNVKHGKSPSKMSVHIIPGIDLEREAIYAVDGFRGAYRVPDTLKGKLVWTGVEAISEACYQILAVKTDDGMIPCFRVKTMTKSEQGGTVQPATRPESKSEGNDKPQPDAEGRSR